MTWTFTRREKPLTWIVLGLYLLAGLPFVASSQYRIHQRSSTECAISGLGQGGWCAGAAHLEEDGLVERQRHPTDLRREE